MADMAKGVAAGAKGEEPARGDRRTTPRTAVLETIAGIIAVDLDGGSNGIILDLGPAGMMVQSMAPLAARSTRTISFTLPDTTTPVRLQAVVVWSDDEGRAGLRFTSVPDDVRRRLETWLATNAARDILEAEPAASSMPPFSSSAQSDFSLDSASDDLPLSFADLAATLDAPSAAVAPSSTPAASRLDTPAAGSPAIPVSQEPRAAESPRVHFVNFSGLDAAAAAAPALDNAPVAPSQASPSEVPADRIDQEAWHVIDEIFRLTPAQGAVVAIAEGDVITCRASRGHAPAVGARLQPEHGLSGECFRSGKVVICDDTSVDPRVPAVVSQRLNLSSIVVVPILGPKSSLGLVEALSSDKHAFTSANVNTLTRLAALMSEVLCPAKPSQVPASVVPAPADVARPNVEPPSVAKPIEPAVAPPPALPASAATKPEPLPPPAAAPSTTVVNKPVVSTTATPGVLTAATPVVPRPQEKTPTAPAAQEKPASAVNTTSADKAAPAPPAKPSAPAGTSVPKPAPPPIVPPGVPSAGQRKPEPLKPLKSLDEKAEQEKARAAKAADEKPPETKIPDQKPRQEKPSAPPPQPVAPAPVAPSRVAMEPASAPRTEAPRTGAEKSRWRPVVPPAKPVSPEPTAPSVYKSPPPVKPPAPVLAKPAPASAAAATAVAPASAIPAPPLPLAETSLTRTATETSTFSTSRTLALGGLATVVLLGIVAAWWTLTHRPEPAQPLAPTVTSTPAESAPAPQAPPQQNTTASANIAADSSPSPSAAASSAAKPPDSKPAELKPEESKSSASKPAQAAAKPPEVFASEVDAGAIRRPSAGRQTQAPLPQVQPPTVVVGTGSNPLALPIKPAQPSLVGPQRVSRGAVPGKVIHRVEPQYPASARAVKLTGTVVLAATIDRQGRPTSVRVVSGPPLLADAALQAYRQWRYEPAMLNNEPVESQTQVSFNFKLPQ